MLPLKDDPLTIADRSFSSRLLVGTGKFASNELMRDALAASETGLVTVALKRASLGEEKDPFADILDFLDTDRYLVLPNTAGAMNAQEAVRIARLAAAAGLPVLWEGGAGLPTDTWVRVQGTLDLVTLNGTRVPAIAATSVEPVDQPEFPYLFP